MALYGDEIITQLYADIIFPEAIEEEKKKKKTKKKKPILLQNYIYIFFHFLVSERTDQCIGPIIRTCAFYVYSI